MSEFVGRLCRHRRRAHSIKIYIPKGNMKFSKLQALCLKDANKEVEQLKEELVSLAAKHNFSRDLCTAHSDAFNFNQKLNHVGKILDALVSGD